jgi:hypothetical protein
LQIKSGFVAYGNEIYADILHLSRNDISGKSIVSVTLDNNTETDGNRQYADSILLNIWDSRIFVEIILSE